MPGAPESELIDSKARAYLAAASIEDGGYGSR